MVIKMSVNSIINEFFTTEALESMKMSTEEVSILHLGQSELPQTSHTLTACIAGRNTKVVFFRSGEYQSRNSTGTYGDSLATGK